LEKLVIQAERRVIRNYSLIAKSNKLSRSVQKFKESFSSGCITTANGVFRKGVLAEAYNICSIISELPKGVPLP